MIALLAEADRLRALAELVGTGALPAHERVTLLAGRLVREAVLQQSATSANDATCSLSRTAALADGVLAAADRAWQARGRRQPCRTGGTGRLHPAAACS